MIMVVSGLLALGLGIGAAALPVPYVVESAGPTFNTLGQDGDKPVISISGHESFPAKGNLDLTTVVMAGGPKTPATIFEVFRAWLDKSKAVYPEELIYPKGTTAEETVQQGEMQVGDRNVAAVIDVPACSMGTDPLAQDENGQPVVQMAITLRHAGTVDDHAAIEQGGVAVSGGMQLVDEPGEQLHVVDLNADKFGNGRLVVAMMR